MARQRGIYHQRRSFQLHAGIQSLFKFVVLLCIASGISSSFALGDANPLQVTLIPELRVVEQHGNEQRITYVPAKQVSQGQEICYTVRIVNLANEKIRHAEVVQVVPANTHLVERSVTGAGALISYSIDGGRNFISAAETRDEMDDNPDKKIRITHVRWQFHHALAPHVIVLARFRVVFD